jgi:hypothetical protein
VSRYLLFALGFLCLFSFTVSCQAQIDEASTSKPTIDTKSLLKCLREGASSEQLATMQAFAKQESAPTAIPILLKVLHDEAPDMDNNVCLELMFILSEHPKAECPVDPLLEVISRKIWTSQQKGAQALYYVLSEKVIQDHEEELYRRLIPLLTSQRSRVYQAALKCLQKISGKTYDADPDQWKTFYESKYPGKKLDLSQAVYEMLAVIKLTDGKYELNGTPIESTKQLKIKLQGLKGLASTRSLNLGAVLQVSDEDMAKIAQTMDTSTLDSVMSCVHEAGIKGLTISPASDVFRAPYSPCN